MSQMHLDFIVMETRVGKALPLEPGLGDFST